MPTWRWRNLDKYIRKAMVSSKPVRICHCIFAWTTVLSIDALLVHVNAAVYVVSLEEVEVRGHLGAGILDGNQLVEGDDDELVVDEMLICDGGAVAGGGGEGGTEADGKRMRGCGPEEEAAGWARRRWREQAEEVVVDGGRHGLAAHQLMLSSSGQEDFGQQPLLFRF